MAFFNYPFHVAKDTPAVANEVQTNFDQLLAWIMTNVMQKDGTNAPTAPVVLPPGPPTSPDQAANKAYVDAVVPVGTIFEYGGTVLPAKWLWCDGATYTNTSQPQLATALGRAHTAAGVPADSFQVPDRRKRVGVGADATEAAKFGLGVKGGQRDSELPQHLHSVPAHGHAMTGSVGVMDRSIDHLHTAGGLITDMRGEHGHNLGNSSLLWYESGAGGGFISLQAGTSRTATWVATGVAGGLHNHAVTGTSGAADRDLNHNHTNTFAVSDKPAFDTINAGTGTTLIDKNLPPYIALNYIIYSGA